VRLVVDFWFERGLLKWDYLNFLQGLVYLALGEYNPQLARKLHDEGFAGGGKRFRLFTFSLLYPRERPRACRAGLEVGGEVRWWFSSPVIGVVEALAGGLLGLGEVRVGPLRASLIRVGVEPLPEFGTEAVFTTLSPVVVSTGEGPDEDGRFRRRFLGPEDPEFFRVLAQNLRRKAEACELAAGDIPVEFEAVGRYKSRLFTSHGVKVRGWQLTVRMRGPGPLLRLAYEAGLGERTAQGFGMLRHVGPVRGPAVEEPEPDTAAGTVEPWSLPTWDIETG
jgi:CRISPR-associated endoribonuclease Cas6